ncbi:MAG: hypothetical protein JRE18_07085 [Deltaproteobacteria bacterium]|nr:hypothetical protein [Deltaproteobacteria bacterium]
MHHHDINFLEEPQASGLKEMLRGDLSIDDYLLSAEVEYPDFSRRMCRLLSDLYHRGKKIIQVEPFLDHLLAIHTFFSQGHRPDELQPDSVLHRVYQAERDATRALIDYYQIVMNGSFKAAIEAIIRFARFDAARFRLRDSLRARALSAELSRGSSAFIEAGAIHLALYHLLKKRLPESLQLKPVFLARKALKILGVKGHLFGPGDQLTLTYIFHPKIQGTSREALLAARSLIYSKLVEKEEISADLETFPHIRNELACIGTVKLLTFKDCDRLFPLIRRVKTGHARELVEDYLVRVKRLPRDSRTLQSLKCQTEGEQI